MKPGDRVRIAAGEWIFGVVGTVQRCDQSPRCRYIHVQWDRPTAGQAGPDLLMLESELEVIS